MAFSTSTGLPGRGLKRDRTLKIYSDCQIGSPGRGTGVSVRGGVSVGGGVSVRGGVSLRKAPLGPSKQNPQRHPLSERAFKSLSHPLWEAPGPRLRTQQQQQREQDAAGFLGGDARWPQATWVSSPSVLRGVPSPEAAGAAGWRRPRWPRWGGAVGAERVSIDRRELCPSGSPAQGHQLPGTALPASQA